MFEVCRGPKEDGSGALPNQDGVQPVQVIGALVPNSIYAFLIIDRNVLVDFMN